ncbi:WAT1-related protein At3g28050-like [Glycine soja]|uniref:WAT1-related protein n=1 Tax=Glycine soja TaxID=3848 RepID=A0A0B2QPV4_GLYSO|nr:WAT1-related protein At3g28050-like [Glycine soja]KHN23566.1 Auxin-induced protein 5NG4 [Glycine soja]RZB45938.1 WAT1-related protein [Glycine soja]
MARRWSFYMDMLPVLVIIGNQLSLVALVTLFKEATLQGMNNHVFVAYTSAVAATLLFPITFFRRRSRVVPPLSFSIASKIMFIGMIGTSSQIMYYVGVSYSSPTLASSIANLGPAFTFILAIIFRMEKIAAKSRSSQAKVVGSIISITGAFVLTLYKGHSIIKAHSHDLSIPLQHPFSFLKSGDADWVIAGILLTAECLIGSLCYIVQADVLKVFPDEVTIVLFYNVTSTVMSTLVALFAVPNANAWKVGLNISLISIICTGTIQKVMGYILSTWALRLKGPVYLASFSPLQIVFSIAMGVIFLGDSLHVGSIVGAAIVSFGFYAVLWGKATEEIEEEVDYPESPATENVPLLQSYGTENL